MLLPILSGCDFDLFGGGNNNSIDFTGVSHPYGGANNNSGISAGDNGGIVSDGGSIGAGINVAAPASGEILAIAKKYYDYHTGVMNSTLNDEFADAVGAVSFDGKLNDAEHAETLCTISAFIAMLEGDGDYAVACAAAAIGWSKDYPRSTYTLASVLMQAGFVTDKDKVSDAKKLVEYAISLDGHDADFYITLGTILEEQKDFDGALAAYTAALDEEPDNNAALVCYLNLSASTGGGAGDGGGIKVGNKTITPDDANDIMEGELSKRDTKTERTAKSMTPPDRNDSKDEALKKLHDIYEKLQPITPADMVEAAFPKQAKELRDKIMTVTDEDKDLGLPEFPSDILLDLEGWKDEHKQTYMAWLNSENKRISNMIEQIGKGTSFSRDIGNIDKTAVQYMLDYNEQVLKAAVANYENYCKQNYKEISKEVDIMYDVYRTKLAEAEAVLPDYNTMIYLRSVASVEYIKSVIPIWGRLYLECKNEGQQLWETMLPYARCTASPERNIERLLSSVVPNSSFGPIGYAMSSSVTACILFDQDAYGEKIVAEANAREAYMQFLFPNKADALKGFTISIEVGPLEWKLSNTSVELEFVEGIALRASYDWKSKQAEAGIGAGIKAKLGAVKGLQVGLESKAYINVAINTDTKEVVDVFVTGEAKGSWGGLEAGGQAKASFMGGSYELGTATKAKFANFGIEHTQTILEAK